MPSFESLSSVFVHVPKAAGTSIYHAAKQSGRVVRIAPYAKVHQPASYFESSKPAWCLIRHPWEWYVSLFRYHVDTGWMWEEPERKRLEFSAWIEAAASWYSKTLADLEIESVPNRWRYESAQQAYNAMIGPGELLRRNVSLFERPHLKPEHRQLILDADALAFDLYSTARTSYADRPPSRTCDLVRPK